MDLLTFVFEREETKGRYQNVQKCVGSCILAQLHTALLDGTLFRSTSTEEFKNPADFSQLWENVFEN